MNEHIFREYDTRGIRGKDLTEESVYDAARAIGTFYRACSAQASGAIVPELTEQFNREYS